MNIKTVLFPFIILSLSFSALAERITIVKNLSFGSVVLKDNSVSHSYSISFAGDVNIDPAYIVITPGSPAELFISEFTPHTLLNVSILVPDTGTQFAGASNPASSQFTIDNHHVAASTITTNALGEAEVSVGATLSSSGSGFYIDATYFNQFTLVVNY